MIDIAERAGLIFLWGGSVVGVALGAAMLMTPKHISSLNQAMSRWVNTDPVEVALDKPHWTERVIYRHHRLVGLILLLGAAFILNTFLFGKGLKAMSTHVGMDMQILISAAANVFIVGSVLAAVIGLILLTRPSMLKDMEKNANRWVSTQGVSRFFNDMHSTSDRFLFKHRRFTGAFLLVGGMYICLTLGYFLFVKH